jgi:type 1 glutamine amidotransferase
MHRMLVVAALAASVLPGLAGAEGETGKAAPLAALIVDGQNNHNWRAVTPLLKKQLEACGRFTVEVATTPQDKAQFGGFKPEWTKYAVVVSNYNGDLWPAETRKAFEEYMANGGGLVIVHAADNSFGQWAEYNKMIGVGGWGGRGQKSGPMLRWRDGKIVRDTGPGGGGSHGANHQYAVDAREPTHPILAGLPEKWMHTSDELYSTLRGPAENLTVLATSFADKAKGGTGEHEPVLMTITYGKGRVFHTVLGHDATSVKCVGFAATLQRGAEWAATGKVTIPKPEGFPAPDKVSVWEGK